VPVGNSESARGFAGIVVEGELTRGTMHSADHYPFSQPATKPWGKSAQVAFFGRAGWFGLRPERPLLPREPRFPMLAKQTMENIE
jgi:hypothetical protein